MGTMKNLQWSVAAELRQKGRLKAHSIFLTKGVGHHPIELVSFELALRDAYLEAQNLVSVSSIYPPQCKIISLEEGVKQLVPGEITFCVLSRTARYGEVDGELLGSAVGLAIPEDPNRFGYIYETYTYGKTGEDTYQEACDGALLLLASSMDPSVDIYNIRSIPQELRCRIQNDAMVCVAQTRKGMWTTTVAAAIYLM